MKPEMTITESPLLREDSHRTEQAREMPIQNKRRTNFPQPNEGTVEADAETTILCTIWPLHSQSKSRPGECHASMMEI